jgi:hypothetical protein
MKVCTSRNFCNISNLKMLKFQLNVGDDWSNDPFNEEILIFNN